MEENQMEMPRYKCHKEVHAVQIGNVYPTPKNSDGVWDHSFVIEPTDGSFAPIRIDEQWYLKHAPHPNGYYVVYEDGYTSFSPQEAFEKGYTRI